MFSVYVLKSLKNGRRYIRYTIDLDKRLQEHNDGKNTSTRNRGPWEIIYCEKKFPTRTAAQKREKELKNMKGGIQFRQLLKDFDTHHSSTTIKKSIIDLVPQCWTKNTDN
jgi:putative endonuclease